MTKKIFCAGFALISLISCGTSKNLYTWNNYDQSSYDYLKKLDNESLITFETTLKEIIESKPRFKRQSKNHKTPKIAPGICAEYGYFLLKKGNQTEAVKMFKKEIALYPESKIFIDRILKKLENENS